MGTFVAFFGAGFLNGSWLGRIPAVSHRLGVPLDVLGLVFLLMGVGSLISMPFASALQRRVTTRTLLLCSAVATLALFTVLALLTSVWLFAACYLLCGMAIGMWDVIMNTHGAAAEGMDGRHIMPPLHGSWGAGTLAGAGVAAVAARLEIPVSLHIPVVDALVVLAVFVAVSRWTDLRHVHLDAHDGPPADFPWRPVLWIGAMMAVSCLVEGAAADWLALHVVRDRGASQYLGSVAYVCFALALTTSRLFGALVQRTLGRVGAVRVGGVVTVLGILLVILAPGLWAVFVGALLWGGGVSAVFPAGISAAGEQGGAQASRAIAVVSTFAYSSMLIGPALLGFVGEHAGLRIAFVITAGFALLYTVGSAAFTPVRKNA